jgi:hypothetical protein
MQVNAEIRLATRSALGYPGSRLPFTRCRYPATTNLTKRQMFFAIGFHVQKYFLHLEWRT